MVCRAAVLVLLLAGCCYGGPWDCYEADGGYRPITAFDVPFTCDSNNVTCNPYLHNPYLVQLDCPGHPAEGYYAATDCVAAQDPCYFSEDSPVNVEPQLFVSAPAAHWELLVDPDDQPELRGNYLGQHVKHQTASTVHLVYRVRPMMGGSGGYRTDECQEISGMYRSYTWTDPPLKEDCPQ